MSIEQLETEADNAASALDALTEELRTIGKKIQLAGKAGDGAKLLELRQRYDALPTLISAATFTALNTEIAVLDAYGEQGAPQTAADRLEVAQAQQTVKDAQQALLVVSQRAGRHDTRMRMNRERRGQLQRRLEDLAGELSQKPGKIVRSLLHPA